MNPNEFIVALKKIIREEVRKEVKSILAEQIKNNPPKRRTDEDILAEGFSSILSNSRVQSTPKKKVQQPQQKPKRVFTSDRTLNELLNDTAMNMGDEGEGDDGDYGDIDRELMAEYGDLSLSRPPREQMQERQIPKAVSTATALEFVESDEEGNFATHRVDPRAVPDHVKNALTRDYRGMFAKK